MLVPEFREPATTTLLPTAEGFDTSFDIAETLPCGPIVLYYELYHDDRGSLRVHSVASLGGKFQSDSL